ncbi:MAG TPA: PAS domain S-box protein [Gammaproteobacteria bacterium]|nr:PAS domain S-box protein [Gammaproteobacteria bacterium]
MLSPEEEHVSLTEGNELLEALPAAVYITDAEGRITFYNEAAAELWGHRPELGSAQWCGSWRLFWPDGRPMPHDQCPMAVALKEGRPVLGMEAIAERPDGTRVVFTPHPKPLKDRSGRVIGALNLLVDITERKRSEIASARLAAIVSSSDDAIISKNLNGIVISWNDGATRIFGYPPEEMVGESIRKIIPPELQPEEDDILARLRRGERIDHFETVRVAKDGRRLDLSITVSPLRDSRGMLVGASKVARDIGERKRYEELQRLLFDELNHRVKNTLATIQAIASQSMRTSTSPKEFVTSFNGRVHALARAHDLLVQQNMKGAYLDDLVREQVVLGFADDTRVRYSGPKLALDSRTAVQFALVLHELATNARKYGALSVPTGTLTVSWKIVPRGDGREMRLTWQESGVPNVREPQSRGFGTTLIERSLEANEGEASIRYAEDGVVCEIRLPLHDEVEQVPAEAQAHFKGTPAGLELSRTPAAEHGPKRILLIEDEPLVAMQIESELVSRGFEVVGPATHVDAALRLIAQERYDAALLDANLGGHPVDELAASLAERSVPTAFVTGYGRAALPEGFRDAEVIAKPFDPNTLVGVLRDLLRRPGRASERMAAAPEA